MQRVLVDDGDPLRRLNHEIAIVNLHRTKAGGEVVRRGDRIGGLFVWKRPLIPRLLF